MPLSAREVADYIRADNSPGWERWNAWFEGTHDSAIALVKTLQAGLGVQASIDPAGAGQLVHVFLRPGREDEVAQAADALHLVYQDPKKMRRA